MNKHFKGIGFVIVVAVLSGLTWPYQISAQTRDVALTIHLRGVYESKISLLSLSGSGTFKPIAEMPGIKNSETTKLIVLKEHLPGEFVLRFDYKEKDSSTPYPSEKNIFINDQDLELWVSPVYCNNSDSTWFQKDEKENATFLQFSKENGKQKEKLGLLQNFLMNYDDTESTFYQQGIEEYEQRRQTNNQWLTTLAQQDKALFVSNLTSLAQNTLYYVWAYATNSVGTAYGNEVIFTTLSGGSTCGSPIIVNHMAGVVAPVTKTVTYGTVTNIPGETSKCWITSNLGASQQATAIDDATEASAGWYWQFIRKQGYKHDGTTRTPNSTWITPINEKLDWQVANDPCAIEFGSGWRIPTQTEWTNVDASGSWTNKNGPWNSALKLHAAGFLNTTGVLEYRPEFIRPIFKLPNIII
jgi:hypothetical protein